MPRPAVYDPWLLGTAVLLGLGGLFMVGSSSCYVAMEMGQDPSTFLWKHLLHLVLGIAALLATLSFPYQALADRKRYALLLLLCLLLLVAVLFMPPVGGARRWFPLGPLKFQPSELAKLVVIVFLASMLARKEGRIHEFWSVPAPGFAVAGAAAFLVLIEPDLGSAVMLLLVAFVMIFTAGLSWRHVGIAGTVGSVAFAGAVLLEPYRIRRVLSFMDPTQDVHGASFQLNQSLIALGSGGLTGAGLGHGHQKAFYLPAAHTDFIFSVIGEELGMVGTGLLLAAFLVIFWRGMRAAVRAPDRFGFYLALGVTNLLVLQALINMGVCAGLLPTKGLPLPFISYGGSSLLASMAAVGLLLNVSKHSN
jgi:cell division protein FtsW